MSNCQKNVNYQFKNDAGSLLKELELSSDGRTLLINDLGTSENICTYNIDSNEFTGIAPNGNNIQYKDPIEDLNNSAEMLISDNPKIIVVLSESGLEVIGVDDIMVKFEVPQINIRYDSANDKIIVQY